jgi:hypothetical protein
MRLFSLLSAVALVSIISFSSVQAEDVVAAKSVTVFDEATLSVPPAFKPTEPKSSIIEHEFVVSGEGDATARMTMMASGGGIQPNIDRWKSQFIGGKAEDQKTELVKVGKWNVHVVDLNGTYKESMGGGPFAPGKIVERADYSMLGAILEHPEGRTYFVKLTGPQSIVKANRDAFIDMVKGLK